MYRSYRSTGTDLPGGCAIIMSVIIFLLTLRLAYLVSANDAPITEEVLRRHKLASNTALAPRLRCSVDIDQIMKEHAIMFPNAIDDRTCWYNKLKFQLGFF